MLPGEFGCFGFAGPHAEVEGECVLHGSEPLLCLAASVNGVAREELRGEKS